MLKSLLERVFGFPPEAVDLGGVEGLPLVVSGAVLDELDEGLVGADRLEDRVSHLEVRPLLTAPDVVHLALLTDDVDGCTVVRHAGPLAEIRAVTVDGVARLRRRAG